MKQNCTKIKTISSLLSLLHTEWLISSSVRKIMTLRQLFIKLSKKFMKEKLTGTLENFGRMATLVISQPRRSGFNSCYQRFYFHPNLLFSFVQTNQKYYSKEKKKKRSCNQRSQMMRQKKQELRKRICLNQAN